MATRVPRDTSRDHPLSNLIATMETGGIERQEAAGQRELVNSDVIPRRVLHSTEADLTALGFVLGEPVDDLFRRATLPEGWKREGSDHAMWSYIQDGLGRERCSIFYKAAFYDRDAHISVTSLRGYIHTCANPYGDESKPVIYDDEWATRDAVAVTATKMADQERADAKRRRSYSPESAEQSLLAAERFEAIAKAAQS